MGRGCQVRARGGHDRAIFLRTMRAFTSSAARGAKHARAHSTPFLASRPGFGFSARLAVVLVGCEVKSPPAMQLSNPHPMPWRTPSAVFGSGQGSSCNAAVAKHIARVRGIASLGGTDP